MKPVVKLISQWTEFADKYPDAGLQEFYTYQLEQEKNLSNGVGKNGRVNREGQLLRIIGRLSSAYALYHRVAMSDMNLPSPESFYYLNSSYQMGEVRKTDLINYQFAETTTGMAAIAKLVGDGFLKERPDPTDARARLISLTEKGHKKLERCLTRAKQVNELLFKTLSDEAIDISIRLLQNIEQEHSKLAIKLKNGTFKDLEAEMTNK